MTYPTLQRIQELFHVDIGSGVIRWRKGQGRAAAGDVAGRIHKRGHREVQVDGRMVKAHHIVYFVATGDWPPLIDHINGQRDDNRFLNLRIADQAANARNRTNWRHKKLLGAHRRGVRWAAVIGFDGEQYELGLFDSEEEAHQEYVRARQLIAEAERRARLTVIEEMQAARHAA